MITPTTLLFLAKITAFLLVILALAPLFKNPTHRALLWTLTFLALPLIVATSFFNPAYGLISLQKPSSPPLITPPTTITPAPPATPIPASPISSKKPNLASFDSPEGSVEPTLPGEFSQPFSEIKKEAAPESPLPWTSVLYFIGFFLALLPWLSSILRVFLLPTSPALKSPLTLWKNLHRNSRKTPQLLFTPSPAAPFTYGLLHPRVLLPEDSLSWPPRRLLSTLAHEAAHLKRRDPLVRFFATLIKAILWFHPLVWIAHRKLIDAQEQACDQAALAHGIAPHDYAEDLLASISNSHHTPPEALAMARWSQLGSRIRNILAPPKTTTMKTLSLTTFLGCATLCALLSIGFADEKAPDNTPRPDQLGDTRGAILDRHSTPLALTNPDGIRTYPLNEIAGHLTGYLSKDQGISNIEKAFETDLSESKSVTLTIDATIQSKCHNLLAAQEFPGAIVVQDPRNGEILALTTYPSFDPNLFIPQISIENYRKLSNDETKPLFNRTIYPASPGSTVKLLASLAGEYAGLDNPTLPCSDQLMIGKIKLRDWMNNRSEDLTISSALETSCNTYFYQLALLAGEEAFRETGALFHLNKPSLPVLQGGTSTWPKSPHSSNSPKVELALAAIGHGQSLISPLEINAITSAISTGTWHQPHLILGEEHERPSFNLVGQGKITRKSLSQIRHGMNLVVQGERGTAKRAAVPGIQLAGKTATVQTHPRGKLSQNTWFTGYGPYENPRYAVTVFLEGAPGSGTHAAPLAAKVFSSLLQK